METAGAHGPVAQCDANRLPDSDWMYWGSPQLDFSSVFSTKDAVRQELGLINQLTSRSEAQGGGTRPKNFKWGFKCRNLDKKWNIQGPENKAFSGWQVLRREARALRTGAGTCGDGGSQLHESMSWGLLDPVT